MVFSPNAQFASAKCETRGKREESLAGVPSLPTEAEKEVQMSPVPTPRRTGQWGPDAQDSEKELRGLRVAVGRFGGNSEEKEGGD